MPDAKDTLHHDAARAIEAFDHMPLLRAKATVTLENGGERPILKDDHVEFERVAISSHDDVDYVVLPALAHAYLLSLIGYAKDRLEREAKGPSIDVKIDGAAIAKNIVADAFALEKLLLASYPTEVRDGESACAMAARLLGLKRSTT